ncbi:hypothetical protein V6N11_031250 [Hibiscus sabdariffa]|uniref:Uncharacterized protein n=1 Tax=Hibiscus sabdariffa TaxID=183260 RepID=A0ABR2SX20_9ROSI
MAWFVAGVYWTACALPFCASEIAWFGSWCTVVRATLARSFIPWKLPHPGVRCLGNLMCMWPPGCAFLRPVPPLLGPSVLGDSRSQGCTAKAPAVVRFYAAKAPTPPYAVRPYAAKAARAGSVCAAKAHRASAPCAGMCAPLALTGDFRPICGLRLPLLGVQVLVLGPICGPCIACLASFTFALLLLLDAEVPPLSPAPSVASSPPTSASTTAAPVPAPAASDAAASVPVSAPVRAAPAASDAAASDVPVTAGRVATSSAPMSAPPPRGKLATDNGEVPYDPMLHPDVSDAMEDSLAIPKGCTLFSDIDGMVQSTGLDDVIDEAADALLHDVASSILGNIPASSTVPATVVSTLAACSSPLPPVSRPVSNCARRLSMPPVPEQDDFEAWYAAQVHAASKAPPPPSSSSGLSSHPAPSRPNKRAASNTDPSRVKRSRPATRTSQAGMSSSNNSSAEAGRQPCRDQ